MNKKKVIIISSDPIGEQMAGPGIRYWHFANALSREFPVVLFTPNDCPLQADFPIRKLTKSQWKAESRDAACVLVQGMTLWVHGYLKKAGVPLIVDLYDPFLFEHLELHGDVPDANQVHKAALAVLIDQLRCGDFFICASEKQRDFWLGMLTALNRVNPEEYRLDKTMERLIGVVPFGLEEEIPTPGHPVLKGVVPGIDRADHVVLWGGGIWNWLDPLTAIRAVDILRSRREDVKLFFMGVRHPNPEIEQMNMCRDAMALSDSLGLTGRYVFFNDWVPYSERHRYLLEADVGVSLHLNHLETRFSFRTRMLDYIWCGLPVVSTSGDVMSEWIARDGLGAVVPPEDPEQLAEAIETLLDFKSRPETAERFAEAAKHLTWEQVTVPLRAFCREPRLSPGKRERVRVGGLPADKLSYYWTKSLSLYRRGEWKHLLEKIKRRIKS